MGLRPVESAQCQAYKCRFHIAMELNINALKTKSG